MIQKSHARTARPAAHAHEKGTTLVMDDQGRVRVALKLSDDAAKADVNALRKQLSNRKAAESFLQNVGILTRTGKLSRRFGG
jgi:hypothetical protein